MCAQNTFFYFKFKDSFPSRLVLTLMNAVLLRLHATLIMLIVLILLQDIPASVKQDLQPRTQKMKYAIKNLNYNGARKLKKFFSRLVLILMNVREIHPHAPKTIHCAPTQLALMLVIVKRVLLEMTLRLPLVSLSLLHL